MRNSFRGAILFLAFTSLVNASSLEEMQSLIMSKGLMSTTMEDSGSILDDGQNVCADPSNMEQRAAFANVMAKFLSKENLVRELVSAWADIEESRSKVPAITHYSDGVSMDFDEGLWIIFNPLGEVFAIYHWDHYTPDAERYCSLLQNIPLVDYQDEHAFFFQGACAGILE